MPSKEENINSLGAAGQRNFRRTLLVPSREENINSLGAAGQRNFRRTLLVPSREENISSLDAGVQHNFKRTLLVPSKEENIERISIAWARTLYTVQARTLAVAVHCAAGRRAGLLDSSSP